MCWLLWVLLLWAYLSPPLCSCHSQLPCKGRRSGQAAGGKTQCALGSWSQGPWSLLGHAFVTLSRCAPVCLYLSVPTLQLGFYFSICSLSTIKPSEPSSSGIQLSQNTCKIPVSKIFQVSMTLVKIFILFFFLQKHLFIFFLYCITGRVFGCITKCLGWATCILLQTCLSVEGQCPKS